MTVHQFSFPTAIHFGVGARRLISGHLWREGLRKPLVITDRGVEGAPFFGEFMRMLTSADLVVGVHAGTPGNPTEFQVQEGVDAYRRHGADSIIGIGGGAALDVAKAVALMVHHPGTIFDYVDGKPNAAPIDREIPVWIAVPTTAGTGSEVGRSTVISDHRSRVKQIIFSPRLLAQAVFADPELTLELPAGVTAATGMDALTHCIEAYLAKGYHPICDGIALEGIRLIGDSLVTAVRRPSDLEARSSMLMASMMGAIAFQKGLGLTHSCAHALGTVCDLHHGLANGIMIDHALRHNLAAVPDRFERIAAVLNLPDRTGEGVLYWLGDLKAAIGIPARLRDTAVPEHLLGDLSRVATEDSCHQNNPRPCTRSDFDRIFTEAFRC